MSDGNMSDGKNVNKNKAFWIMSLNAVNDHIWPLVYENIKLFHPIFTIGRKNHIIY